MSREADRNIVVLTFMGMGDNVMALQALTSFEAGINSIRWVCKPDSAELLTEAFSGSNVFVMDKGVLRPSLHNILASVKGIARLFAYLRNYRDKAAVILDYKWKPVLLFGILCRLACVKSVISCTERRLANSFLSKSFAMKAYSEQHEVIRYGDLFRNAGLTAAPSPPPSLERYFPEIYAVDTHGVSWPSGKVILLAPGSYRRSKRWRVDNYHAIAKLLVRANHSIAIVGDIQDKYLAMEILRGIDPKVGRDLCGKLGIKELASEMLRADLLLTNDSALMHFADLVGLRVIALFGVTRPERCGPFSQLQNSLKATSHGSGTYSFGEFPDYDDSCINTITVGEVWKTLVTVLN